MIRLKKGIRRYTNFSHPLFVGACTFLFATSVFANPVLDNVAAGQVSIHQNTNSTVINQTSQKAILNWQSFNIGAQESTHFQQPAGGVALNRINPSQGVSEIYGRLTATGKIILVNPAGIFFGPGSYVNVGGLIATTANISNEDFLNNYYHFANVPGYNGAVVNQGQIIAADHGLVALVGGAVSNEGYIQANIGRAVLASGDSFTMTFAGNDMIGFSVDSGIKQRAQDKSGNEFTIGASNTGSIIANGGNILISAKAVAGVLDNSINMQGIAQAKSVSDGMAMRDGEIIIWGDQEYGKINLEGTLDASSNSAAKGGIIIVKGYELDIHDGTHFDVSSTNGDGGFVETSGIHDFNIGNMTINTSAPNGKAGTWLIDPADINITTVDANITGSSPFTPTATGSTLNVDTLVAALGSGNVTVLTTNDGFVGSGNITVSSGITWTSANTLLLQAFNNIIINAPISGINGSLHLSAVNAASSITTGASGSVDVNNFNLLQGRWHQVGILPAFNVRNNFQINSGVIPNATTQFIRATSGNGTPGTPYTLVDIFGLQGIGSNTTTLTQSFNLGSNIDATSTTNWNNGNGFVPIGNRSIYFTGLLDGQGYILDNLYANAIAYADAGLIGSANNATLRNISITNVNITGGETVGPLVGFAVGATNISRIYTSGIVTSTLGSGNAGGIAGAFQGTTTLTDAYSTTTVNGVGVFALGGIIGNISFGSPLLTRTYAAGEITGTAAAKGGIAGYMGVGAIGASNLWDTKSTGIGICLGASGGGSCSGTAGTYDNTGGANLKSLGAYTAVGWTGFISNTPTTIFGTIPSTPWFIFQDATRPMLMMEYNTNISNAHQLQLAGAALANNYTLNGNLDVATAFTNRADVWGTDKNSLIGSGFSPIGNLAFQFAGTLNGQQYAINNLYINNASNNIGLFGVTSTTALITNLGVINQDVTGNSHVGGIVGYNLGNITNSYTTGQITATSTGSARLGGIAGYSLGTSTLDLATISNSFSSATVSTTATGGVQGNYVGGLVGWLDSYAVIDQSYFTGFVDARRGTGGALGVGGLVGGLVGGTITNSYSTGNVAGYNIIGGIAGFAQNIASFYSTDAYINNTYSAGYLDITGIPVQGGLVGDIASGSSLTNSFWDTSTSNQTNAVDPGSSGTVTNVIGGCLSGTCVNGGTVNMSLATTFSSAPYSWDFASVWNIVDTYSYPYLRVFYSTTPRAISGLTGVNPNSTVNLVVNGAIAETARTTALNTTSQFYFLQGLNNISGINNSIADATPILIYLNDAAQTANVAALTPITTGSLSNSSGLDLTTGSTVRIGNNGTSGALSNTQLATVLGALNLTDFDILYSFTGNDIDVNFGNNFISNANTSYLLDGNLSTTFANITIGGGLSVTGNRSIASSITGNIAINSTINSPAAGLTINSAGTASLSTITSLTDLTVTAASGITANGSVTTSGNQTYSGVITLLPASTTTFTTTGAGDITFNNNFISNNAINFAGSRLDTNSAGQVIFNGSVGLNSQLQIDSVNLTAAGGIYFNGSTVSTNQGQTYNSPVHLTGTVNFTNYLLAPIQFLSTIDGPGSFTSNFYSGVFAGTNPQVVTFGGSIGAITPLTNFALSINQSAGVTFNNTVDASGAINITAAGGFFNATSTPPNVIFNAAVGSLTIPTSLSVTSAVAFVTYTPSIQFNNTVNTSGALTLSSRCDGPICTLNGPVTLNDTVGTLANPVGSLSILGSQINLNMDNVYSNGAQSYTGPIVIGTVGTASLISNASDITTSSTISGSGTNTLLINNAGNNSLITGAIDNLALVKSGVGRLILTGNNTYTGGTSINTGTLQVGNGGATGAITGNIANATALIFDTSNDFTIGVTSIISGAGSLTQDGSGTITISGANTYTGTTSINNGALSINTIGSAGANTSLGNSSSAINLGAGTLQYTGIGHLTVRPIVLTASGGTLDASGSGSLLMGGGVTGNTFGLVLTGTGTANQSGAINTTSGTVTKNGSGTWTLSGANNYTGTTTINAGTLVASNPTALGTTAAGTIVIAGATLNINNAAIGAESLALNGSLTATGGSSYTGLITLGDNSLIGANNSSSFALSGGLINNGFSTTFATNDSGTINESGSISGSGAINVTGNASFTSSGVTFSNANQYTGATTISSGRLIITHNDGLGNGTNNTSAVTVLNNGSLRFSNVTLTATPDLTVNGNGTGFTNGALNLTGINTFGGNIILGSNSQFEGNTLNLTGDLSLSSFALGLGDYTQNRLNVSGLITGTGRMNVSTVFGGGGQTYFTPTNTNNSFSGGVTVGGGGRLYASDLSNAGGNSVAGTGLITLGTTSGNSGHLFYTGATASYDKSITLGGAASITNVSSGGALTLTGNLIGGTPSVLLFDTTSGDITLSGSMVGNTNTIFKQGAGTLTLSGTNSNQTTMSITQGIVNIASAGGLGNGTNNITSIDVASGSQLNIGSVNVVATPTVTLNGTGVSGNGALYGPSSSGTGSFGGRIALGSAATIGVNTGGTLNITGTWFVLGSGNNLTLTGGGNGSLSQSINTGAGTVTKDGAGTWALTATNSTYTGRTRINSGTLSVASLANGGSNSSLGATAASTAIEINNNAILSYTGGTTSTNRQFATSGTGGTIQTTTANTLTLSGAINNAGTSLTFNTTNSSGNITASNSISGAGSLTKSGSGTLTLSGANNYSGVTTISAGTLQIGAGGTTGTLGSNSVTNNGALVFDRTDSYALSNVINGSGSLTQQGAGGILTISGVNGYLGGTTLSAGTIIVGNSSALGTGTLNLNGGTLLNSQTMDLSNNYVVNGNVEIGNTIFAQVFTLSGDGNLNSGALTLSIDSYVNLTGTLSGGASISTTSNNSITTIGGALIDNIGYTGTITSVGNLGVASPTNGLGIGNIILNAGALYPQGTNVTLDNPFTVNGLVTFGIGSGGDLTMTGNATLNGTVRPVNGGGGVNTFSGNLSGAGTISLFGFATNLTISGANNSGYTGNVVFDAGSLTIGSATNALGALGTSGTITFANAFSPGILQASVPTTLNNNFSVTTDNTVATIGGANSITMLGTGSLDTTTSSIDFANSAGTITLNNTISGSGYINKSGAGSLALSAANSYTGNTTLSAGSVDINTATDAFGVGGTLVLNGGSLQTSLPLTITNPFTIDTSTTLGGSNNLTFSNNGALNTGTLTVTNSATTTFDGVLSGAGDITFNSALGTFILNNDNSYAGITTLSAGTLQIGSGSTTGTFGSGDVINNGTLVFNNLSNSYTISNAISGNGNLIQMAAGSTLNLDGNNSYTGTTTISAGTLYLINANALGDGVNNTSSVTVLANASLTLGNINLVATPTLTLNGTGIANSGALYHEGNTDITFGGNIILGSDSTIGTINSGLALTGNINNSGFTLTLDATVPLGVSGNISGSGGLTVTDAPFNPVVSLSGNNTYTGATNVLSGILLLASNNALGDGTDNTSSVTVASGAELHIADITLTAAPTLTLNGTGFGEGALIATAGTGISTYSGDIILGSNSTISVRAGGNLILSSVNNLTGSGFNLSLTGNGDGVLNANIATDSGGVTKADGGTWTLTGDSTYSGNTLINAGTLQIGNGGSSGSIGTGNITNNGNLIFNVNNTTYVNGNISGTGSLTNTDSTLVLTGTNTYSGTTTINSGKIQIGDQGTTGSLGTGDVLNNDELIFARTDIYTVNNFIDGVGFITMEGNNGTLVLNGANTFTGGSSIGNFGTIRIGNNNALGSGGIFSNQGTLEAGANGLSINNTFTVFNDTTIHNNGHTFTLNGELTGSIVSGFLYLTGSGTTILNTNITTPFRVDGVVATTDLVLNGSILTNGNQSYANNVTLTGPALFDTSGSGTNSITFNGNILGGQDLTLQGSGDGTYLFTINGLNANTVNIIADPSSSNNLLTLNTGGTQDFVLTSSNTGVINNMNNVTNFNFSNIHNLDGGSGGQNSLTGANIPNNWIIAATNGGSVTNLTSFTNMQDLIGGTDRDIFVFNAGSNITGNVDGGDGIDGNNDIDVSTMNSLLLSLNIPTIPNVFDAGEIRTVGSSLIASFTQVQRGIGDGSGYIQLPNMPNIKVTYYDSPTNRYGEIADPFYFSNWNIGNPPPQPIPTPTPSPIPPTGNLSPDIAPIINQPVINANNNGNGSGTANYGVLNTTYITPLLGGSTVDTGAACYRNNIR